MLVRLPRASGREWGERQLLMGKRMDDSIPQRRLRNQLLAHTGLRRPADVVAWFGAMQAQDYQAATWAIGLRMNDGAVAAQVERAFADGGILRTHVLRPTWHFVTPADIRWLLDLTGPRVQRIMSYYNRQLGLDDPTLTRALGIIERAVAGGRFRTRAELGERLERAGIVTAGFRLARLVMHAELEAVICSGPRRAKQFTYALVAERAANAPRLPRDEALAALARRFWRTHGPATIRDFVWWSGLTSADAKRAIDIIRAQREDVHGRTYWTVATRQRDAGRDDRIHLLPVFDEYMVAYRDREAVPHGPAAGASPSRPVIFQNRFLIGGQVMGTWRATRRTSSVRLDAVPFHRLTRAERARLAEAAQRYGGFLEAPVEVAIE